MTRSCLCSTSALIWRCASAISRTRRWSRAASLACVQGLGVTRLMHYQVADELADGRLIRVLNDFETADLPIQLVYPHALQLSPRVKAFVEWAIPQLEKCLPDPSLQDR
ncbi:Transcriptional regulator, LysR family [Pseudomonas savastanoi pv. nerii]|uniref:Transcriptional regulator, LysR family n=1 Tax=Pseudomonas savastanoi pv. nerii TaxID=360921 RepID=A0AB74BCS1_PSESS|nr:Transcriptional regulator, LysR family [Pseudomonas savastanoi pv. savastanoi]RML81512.1 Transcriptional regulator, LysR family [Pseudomonas savastanoi pv. savastanoi]RMT70148.1 Transcriptional regulator, LysR family [Pseudomonas savastanoi pv. nerii]